MNTNTITLTSAATIVTALTGNRRYIATDAHGQIIGVVESRWTWAPISSHTRRRRFSRQWRAALSIDGKILNARCARKEVAASLLV